MEILGVATPLATMDWGSLDLNGVFNQVIAVVPFAVPVVVAFLGFKKGYGFLKKQIKGA